MTRTDFAILIVTVVATGSSAYAQQIEAPPRASGISGSERPVDQERNRQELIAETTFLGGFDDNLTPVQSAGPFAPRESGYAGTGTGRLRYFAGRNRRSIDVSGRGFVNSYRGIGPAFGAGIDIIGDTSAGRRTDLGFTQSVHSDPFFSLGFFGALQDELGTANPDTNPSNSVTEDRTLAIDSMARIRHQWARNLTSDGSYTFSRQAHTTGAAFDSRSQSALVSVEQGVGRGTALRSSYRYTDSIHTEINGRELPETNQNVQLGIEHERNVSRTRRLTLSVGAGAMHVDSLDSFTRDPVDYWSPSGYGSIQYDFARTWNFSGDYRRELSVIRGVVPESYISNTATVRTGGFVSDRVDTAFIFGYGNGQGGATAADQYDGYTGTAQLRVRLAGEWSLLGNYTHYQYRLSEGASLFLGVPTEVHRNAIWAGFAWAAPLVRRYMRGTSRP
jgi:hypothetical protein